MKETALLIGTYTTHTPSQGVYRLRVRQETVTAPEPAMEANDPSYLLRSGDALYWVDEALGCAQGQIGCARRDGDAYAAQALHTTAGENPCHLAQSPSGTWLAAANYSTGEIAIFCAADLSPAGVFPGSHGSAHPTRQQGPHAHFVHFRTDTELLACDLGADCLRRLRCEDGQWREEAPALTFPAGSGPRHMLVRGDLAYVICELSAELLTASLSRGEICARTPMLFAPEDGTAAALRWSPTGELLASHRGADVISVFSLENPEKPTLRETIPCGGKGPRDFFSPEDGVIVCACQASDEVTVLRRVDGAWQVAQRLALPAPVCVIAE